MPPKLINQSAEDTETLLNQALAKFKDEIRENNLRLEKKYGENLAQAVNELKNHSLDQDNRMGRLETMLEQVLKLHTPKTAVDTGGPNNQTSPAMRPPILPTPTSSGLNKPTEGTIFIDDSGIRDTRFQDNSISGSKSNMPRFDFPVFNGHELVDWVEDCEYYFDLYQTPEFQKTQMAIPRLIGDAREWYRSYKIDHPSPTWNVLVEELKERFLSARHTNPVKDFMKIQQTGSIEDYIKKFEKVRARLITETQFRNDNFYIQGFLGGLRDDICCTVDRFEPRTLAQAYRHARNAEVILDGPERKARNNYRPPSTHAANTHTTNYKGREQLNKKPIPINQVTVKPTTAPSKPTLTFDQMGALGLCFYCGEKYSPTHICAHRKHPPNGWRGYKR